MSNNIIFQGSFDPQMQPIEKFFKIILIDKNILPVLIDAKPGIERKLEKVYTPEELKNEFNALIESIQITLNLTDNFPKKFVLETISKFKKQFQTIEFKGENKIFQSGYSIQDIPGLPIETIEENNPNHYGMNLCLEFCEIKYKSLKRLEEIILSANTHKSDKMKTKFSVGDISLLFRLLKEEGVLYVENNTELYRFISSNFSSKSSETISDKSIKNKFLSPDNIAIKNLDILLVNLRQHLKKM
jgi:hypothetical protein